MNTFENEDTSTKPPVDLRYKPSPELVSKAQALFPQETVDDIINGIFQVKKQLPPTASDDEILNHAQTLKAKVEPIEPTRQPTEQMGPPTPIQAPIVQPVTPQQQVLDKYSNIARENLVAKQKESSSGPAWAAGIAALGAGIAGKDAMAAGQGILNMQDKQRNQELEQFDIGSALQKQGKLDALSADKTKRESDPNSEESKMVQELAKKYMPGTDFSKSSAAFLLNKLPFLEKSYAVDMASADRRASAEDRNLKRQEIGLQKEALSQEKRQKLETPYGLANTETDAKALKDAHESKQNFDSKITEMIELRKKYGPELFNREAVARGKQLSKDLLLEYKNMAKLGVLSKSDEDIINAIIPADPLAFQVSGLVGQDPIMTQLTKFKTDSDKDFATRIATRTRQGIEDYKQGKKPGNETKPKQVVQNGHTYTLNEATGKYE